MSHILYNKKMIKLLIFLILFGQFKLSPYLCIRKSEMVS